MKIETTGQLRQLLEQWPDDTPLVVNTLSLEQDDGYIWHRLIGYEPSEDERVVFAKGDTTYLALGIDMEVVGEG